MTTDELNKIKGKVVAQYRRTGSRGLNGMIFDMDYFLSQSHILKVVSVKKTGDEHCLIMAKCKVDSGISTAQEIATEIERIWVEDVSLPGPKAHSLSITDVTVTLDFLSWSEDTRFYITGSIVVA